MNRDFTAIGIYTFVWWLYENVLSSLISIIWYSGKQLIFARQKLSDRYGSWAVITGATDGIGKGYAVHLARMGMNLVLISRSEPKLINVAREIQNNFGVQVKWIVADFSNGATVYSRIWKVLKFIDVGILVNNVGYMPQRLDVFDAHTDDVYLRMVNVNVLSVLLMTHMVLPHMKQVRRGIIVNVSSHTAYYPAAYMTVYSASKAFGHNMTLALQNELRGTGVECQLVVPQFVRTNMTGPLDLSMFGGSLVPDGISYGRWATWTIGKTNHTSGHWYHSIQLPLHRLIPSSLFRVISGKICERLKKIQDKEVQNMSTKR
ncbi:inactive hydroxysteroid dehydrogenase-like protein 1 isoform X2 [Wyeomyia smithii]|uniref:inactive hydroxysteroid dehydrogenase-like protein 1 isoform X2 n=1 Tax=Wyeomyia smithii TaxID=174621 RepID=UPI0024680CE4|nr:inactive hydroxysteroid dehydrogenase-like protein 1 isoform X2 [Wyeomyia smithii]